LKNLPIPGEDGVSGNSSVFLNCAAGFLIGDFWQAAFEMF